MLASVPVLCCCTALGTAGSGIRNLCFDLRWSYGDSNPTPLACNQQATRPPTSIPAGPSLSVHPQPPESRHVAVLSCCIALGVQGRCGTRARQQCPHQRPRMATGDLRLLARLRSYSSAESSASPGMYKNGRVAGRSLTSRLPQNPYVNLSIHTALVTLVTSRLRGPTSSARTCGGTLR